MCVDLAKFSQQSLQPQCHGVRERAQVLLAFGEHTLVYRAGSHIAFEADRVMASKDEGWAQRR